MVSQRSFGGGAKCSLCILTNIDEIFLDLILVAHTMSTVQETVVVATRLAFKITSILVYSRGPLKPDNQSKYHIEIQEYS